MATAMGRHRDHRTGCECRRSGQRDHHLAQHDLTSMCGADHQLPAGTPRVK
jgi:ribosomal protein L37E